MRVTHAMMYRTALADLERLRTRAAQTQREASTGLRITKPSDDPSGAAQVVTLESQLASLAQFERNIGGTRARVAAAEGAVANAAQLLLRARELAIAGANGTHDATTRSLMASEVEGLHTSMLSEGNARFASGHLFAGHAIGTAPFVAAGSFGTPPPASPTVSFAGDSNETQVAIEDGATVSATFDGRRVFLGDANGDGVPDAGREDVFAVLADLRDALELNDPALVAATLPRIDTALDQLQTERTNLGVVESRLISAEQRIGSRKIELETRLSGLRDADFADVVSRLVQQETALSASLEVMSRLLPPTLMDFLS